MIVDLEVDLDLGSPDRMASAAPFQAEDNTDEDFFDKLVDDDEFGVAGSHTDEPAAVERALSSLSLGDDAPPEKTEKPLELGGEKPAAAGGVKVTTSVKEVQWSAFSVDSQQPFTASSSDFLLDNEFADQQFSLVENEFADNQSSSVENSIVEPTTTYAEKQVSGDGTTENAEYWENLYPGWKYDHTTGQWYQVDNYEPQAESVSTASSGAQSESSGISYLQQSTPMVLETIAEDYAMSSVTSWNQGSYAASEYPPNMVFDPQYPGWYYDTNTQQWHDLESYTQAMQGTSNAHAATDANASANFISEQNYNLHSDVGQSEQYTARDQASQGSWDASTNNYYQQNMWQPQTVDQGVQIPVYPVQQQAQSSYGLAENATSHTDQQIGLRTTEPVYNGNTNVVGYQGFAPAESIHQFTQPKTEQAMQTHQHDSYYGNQNLASYPQQQHTGANGSHSQLSYMPTVGRSPDGRPPHALVTFGFGGKLIVMKENSLSTKSDFASQGTVGGTVSILNLMEVVMDRVDASSIGCDRTYDYFHALCQQSFPGPLTGVNPATKDVIKWIDQKIASCESPSTEFRKDKHLSLLLSLLKISFQHYGKLRSPFGADPSLEENDGPESAVTKLFASARKNSGYVREYGFSTHCIQNIPSEGQMRATAVEVQNLLVSGRRKDALQCAQEGQLWGPALVLAAQLGDKFYVDTVRQMAHHQFISGSPLRTLCLLIAGQPADVFSADCFTNSFTGAVNAPHPTEIQATSMLNNWEENLAIITANRTKDDELVILHLGDCLWRERGEITAAHTCYLVAEANFQSYSDSARLCLIGADHMKNPRTYASPEAIQRTEMYEYSKVLGNSQFIMLPLQPYKLIYAYMLAEVGKVADSMRYCQTSLKLLKNSGRTPEVETWKSLLSALEDRLRAHQQGGYSTNLDPAKLVGKLFTSIDRSIHRIIGAPPPLPPMPESNKNVRENYSMAPSLSNSQSTMAMSSLIPSASVEAINELAGDGNRKTRHNRSVSEPNFGISPKQVGGSADTHGKTSGGPSRFGRIGSQLLQKTMGWVSRSRPDHQAKLGETNKFYYDDKLKRWVEEGVEPAAEEAALGPPPTAAAFQNGTLDYNISNAIRSQVPSANGGPEPNSPPLEHNSGIPPIPPSQNQFSARGRMGVRSRYVDTFNKGGRATTTNSFQSASAPSMKSAAGAKFFVPTTPAPADGQTGGINPEASIGGEPSTSAHQDTYSSPPTSSSSQSTLSIPRFPSMDNLNTRSGGSVPGGNVPASLSRRASWSGANMDTFNPNGIMPVEGHEVPSSFISNNTSPVHSSSSSSVQLNGGNAGDELHEVEL